MLSEGDDMKERLKQIREQAGVSQTELARRVGVTRSTVSKLESGDINFTEQMIKSICREFNVNYFWLTKGEGEMFDALPESLVDELAQQYDLDDIDKRIVLGYLRLSQYERNTIKKYIKDVFGQ